MRVKKNTLFFVVFFLAGIVSRAIFASKDFTHMDAVLYAIGTFDYSVGNNTPPFPGYFLYIMSAKFLNLFTHNPHASLMCLSIFYSGLTAGLLYYFGNVLKGSAAGAGAAVLFLTSPLFWHRGINIYGYLNSGFFILLTALLGYKIIVMKKNSLIFWFSISLAVLIGVRPQESIVMLPLYIFVLFNTNLRLALFSIAVLGISCVLWAEPLIIMSGGLKEYLMASRSSGIYIFEDSVFSGGVLTKLTNHAARMWLSFLWAYFAGGVLLFYPFVRFLKSGGAVFGRNTIFFAVWLLPVLSFNLFVQFGEIGHGMGWGLGFLLILGYAVETLSRDLSRPLAMLKNKSIIFASAIVPIVLCNLFFFFNDFDKSGPDFYDFHKYRPFNYPDVVKHNRFLTAKINLIEKSINQKEALILTSPVFSHQVMFHLPEAIVVQPNIVSKKNNNRLFIYNRYKSRCFQECIVYSIPEGVTKLVIFDDIFFPFFENSADATYIKTPDNNNLLVCDVSGGQRVVFGYHSIRVL